LTIPPHSSSADFARELFKHSKNTASFCVYNEKNIFGFVYCFFCEWRHK